ncbi:MAG: hypothetical protein AAGA96_20275 [Verrucomicrobiota bacterium]
MTRGFPAGQRYLILKNEQSLGPFTVVEILDQIDRGLLSYEDVCLREGGEACQRLREVLDWEEEAGDDPDVQSSAESEILYRGHPSILSSPLSSLGLVGGVFGGFWFLLVDLRLTLLCFVAAIASLAHLTLQRFSHDYLVNRKRIELIQGLIARSSNEVRIADIRAINVSCRGF